MFTLPKGLWALVLGGSSGFGLASAHALAKLGLNLFIVHRDRKATLKQAQLHFDEIAATGVQLKTFNKNALDQESMGEILNEIEQTAGKNSIRLLLHSIAIGNLKPIAPGKDQIEDNLSLLANEIGIAPEKVQEAVDKLAAKDKPQWKLFREEAVSGTLSDEDMSLTIFSMGTSLLSWVQHLHGRDLFYQDARVVGLTSEGNQKALPGYGAVSCAKASLEALSRSIAAEFGPLGIRSNVIQAGCTLTPSFKKIPNHELLEAKARIRNPLGRLTTPEDVSDVVAFLATDQAKWINGSIIPVDGGEKICG